MADAQKPGFPGADLPDRIWTLIERADEARFPNEHAQIRQDAFSMLQETLDPVQVALALYETTARNCPNWTPADCPSEIVVDLINERDDLRQTAIDGLERIIGWLSSPTGLAEASCAKACAEETLAALRQSEVAGQ